MYLCIDGSVLYMEDTDQIKLEKKIPLGIYQLVFNKGSKLEKTSEFKLSHGKIYGKSQTIANHIVEAFKKTEETRNLGVLLSGGRGLGKTLTSRLIVEQLKDEYPIIVVSEYTPDLAEFLSHLHGCVILMDEFEKFMGGNIRGNDVENEQSKQETLLSIFDGNTGCQGNLFILTANNTCKIDENLKSRPGRIRYHYKYESEAADVVRAYCQDNLNDKSKIEEVVRALGSAKYVSMDIITAFVDELNTFPELTSDDVKAYFNIEKTDRNARYTLTFETPEGHLHYTTEWNGNSCPEDRWFTITPADKNRLMKANDSAVKSGSYDLVLHLNCTLSCELPAYIYGSTHLPVEDVDIDDVRWWKDLDEDKPDDYEELVAAYGWKLIDATVEDKDFSKFAKTYDKGMAV